MKKVFYLLRHGNKNPGKGNPTLSDIGTDQANITGYYLKKKNIQAIYSSPYIRAKITAQIIAEILDLPVNISNLLSERSNWDDSSMSFDNFLDIWSKSTINRDWRPPIGDSSIDSGKRLEKFILNQMKSVTNNILVVTHGGIIADYLRNNISDLEINSLNSNVNESNNWLIAECSLTVVEVQSPENKIKVKSVSDTNHLIY